ncbi:MAG: TCR/Tet family MFS transporter [Planctomycetota bacterium]
MAPTQPKRAAAMAFILLTLFIDILAIGIIIPVLPGLVKQFLGGSEGAAGLYVGLIAAVYSAMQFLCAPIVGAISDRYGRRPVILGSLFGLGVDFLIMAVAPTLGWLFLGRVVAGMMGASFSTANAYIADISTPETRARNFGLVGAMFGLGFIIGPALGGVLGEYGLRLPFYAAACLSLVNWLYGYFVLPESLPPEKRSSGLKLASLNPFRSIARLRVYPMVAGLAVAFVFSSLAQRGLENVWVLSMEYRFDWTTRTNGLALALVGLMATFVQGGMIRPFIRRFGERRTALIGTVVSAIAFAGYGLVPESWMVFCVIVFGSLSGVAGPAIQGIVAGEVPSEEQGRVQGALTSMMSLTSIFAPLLFTAGLFKLVVDRGWPIQWAGLPFLFGSALFAMALLTLGFVFVRHPGRPKE